MEGEKWDVVSYLICIYACLQIAKYYRALATFLVLEERGS